VDLTDKQMKLTGVRYNQDQTGTETLLVLRGTVSSPFLGMFNLHYYNTADFVPVGE